jgi:hypothetical protein
VKLGNAFDIVAERNQTDFQVISDRVFEMGFSVTIRKPQGPADYRRG